MPMWDLGAYLKSVGKWVGKYDVKSVGKSVGKYDLPARFASNPTSGCKV